MNREELVLIVCRTNISPNVLQPLQLLLPTLQMAAPLALYTSSGRRVPPPDLYASLSDSLLSEGECSLTETLRSVLHQRSHDHFRVCIMGGEQVNWDIVLEYKRRKILIDTAGINDTLSQVSHTTGGISKILTPATVTKTFLTDFSLATDTRKYFLLQRNIKVEFHLQAGCCPTPLSTAFFTCSACMYVYCPHHAPSSTRCTNCQHEFDPQERKQNPDLELPLKPDLDKPGQNKNQQEKVELN